ncbi:NADH dehydrogenase [ubiquinone] iron-sulfur protein 1, mitochondrial [Trifolium repens]|nr:NADH dehydrogenase [ubiquinone] iron-sulfur protein 1, mitochondrial [Trifolium repens]
MDMVEYHFLPTGVLDLHQRLQEHSPYPRELKNTETNDVTDTVGSNIRKDSRGPEVIHIVPRLNEVRF